MQTWPLLISIILFPVAAIIIGFAGIKIIKHAEYLARVTGIGQAVFGAVFIGATTSLSGLITSLSVAYQGYASLAITNSLGGIAVQTVSLGFADLAYRRVNLEHAAASETNLVQGVLLVTLLIIPLFAATVKNIIFFNVSPFSIILIVAYVFGIKLVSESFKTPMWKPRLTSETRIEKIIKKERSEKQLSKNWFALVTLALILSFSGWAIGKAGISLSIHAHLKESLVGGLFTAVTTSLPELVIAIAAVKRGALNLAVGNIIGGNTFDVLFIALADFFYRKGSIYAAMTRNDFFWVALNVILISILLLGLLRREKHGIANIGFESALIMLVYVASIIYAYI